MDLSSLLPSPAELAKAKVEGFAHSTLAKLAKDLGACPEILRQIKNNGERYDIPAFMADFPRFPWEIAVDRVESYSVEDLFRTPTKSPVFAAFVKAHPDWGTTESLLFFKAAGFTTLVMGSVARMATCNTVLCSRIRKASLYVTTYAEFIETFADSQVCAEG
jgi:hypothetical protein